MLAAVGGLEMSWNPHIEVHYYNTSYPYNSAGSFMEYFEGLTYEHVNFIFDGASHDQVPILWWSLIFIFVNMVGMINDAVLFALKSNWIQLL